MKYIKYWNYYKGEPKGVYLFEEDEDYLYVYSFLLIEWLTHIQKKEWLSYFKPISIPKKDFFSVQTDAPALQDSWIFSFPVSELDFSTFHHIVTFFDLFLSDETNDLTVKMQTAFQKTHALLEPVWRKKLLLFLKEQYKERFTWTSALKGYMEEQEDSLYQPISFLDPFANEYKEAYLVKEDHDFYYTCEPLLFHWMMKLDKLELLDKMALSRYPKSLFSYTVSSVHPSFPPFIFHFPIQEIEAQYLKGVIYFFETFEYYKDFPFIKRLEICTRHKRFPISHETLKRLVRFIAENFKRERIRMLYSEQLREFLE